MRPELERIKQRIRHGDISQDVLDALAKAVPTDSDFEEIMGGAPSDMDSFKEVASRIQHLEAIIKPKLGEPAHTVRFIDYDGTIISEVDLDDLPLKAMPQAPDHSNDFVPLTFTGWTTTLEKINSTKHFLDVGAQYKATDEKMHLAIEITKEDIENEDNTFVIKFKPVSEDIVIDWGNGENATIPAYVPESDDAPAPDPIARSVTYSEAGQYDIAVSSDAENMPLWFDVFQSENKTSPYSNGNKVKECVIGCNVEEIQYVFSTCYSMRSLVIPDNVKVIGGFSNCYALYGLVIPNSVTEITSAVFQYCHSLQNLVIPDSVISIGGNAFYNCYALSRLVIPDSVTSLNGAILYYCYSLQSLYIGDGVQYIINNSFYYCQSLHDLTIGKGINAIYSNAFYECLSLQSLELPNGVTRIDSGAFYKCYTLSRVVIPASLTNIGGSAFNYCYSLKDLIFRDGLPIIGNSVFYNCYSLQNLVIPDSVISIGSNTFYNCYALNSLTLGKGLTSIGGNAFYNCYSLNSVVIPDGITEIDSYAFFSCYSLQNLVIPDGVTSIGDRAFCYCYSLQNLVIPDSVTSIGNSAFNYCYSLHNLTIGNGVTSIGDSAFYNCNSLSSLVIPDSVISIGSNAFYYDYSLNSVYIGEGLTTIGNYAFALLFSAKIRIRQAPGSFALPASFANSYKCSVEWGYGMDIVGFEVANDIVANETDVPVKINYIYKSKAEEGDPVLTEGNYTITCSDNATITDGMIRPLANSGTVTVTVTANDDSGYSVTKELDIVSPAANIGLNNGQWVETESNEDGHMVYKSDAGSYQISYGESRCTISVVGYSKLKIWAKVNTSSSYYNYVLLGKKNTTVTRSGSYAAKISSSDYSMTSYSLDSGNYNTVEILYSKGSSSGGDDRAYFYFTVE